MQAALTRYSHMLLTSSHDPRLFGDMFESTKDYSITSGKSINKIFDFRLCAKFLY